MPRRPTSSARGLLVPLLATGLIAVSALVVPSASAAPEPTIAQVARTVTTLQQQAEQATEQYNAATIQLASLTVRLKAARQTLTRQQQAVAAAKQELGQVAAESYRRGPASTLDMVLSGDPQDYLAQAGLLPSLGQQQAGAVQRLQTEQERLTADEATIRQQQSAMSTTQLTLQLTKNTVLQKLAMAQAQLATLQEAQRQALLRAQQADRYVAAAEATGPGGVTNCRSQAVAAPNAQVKAMLAFACAQIGRPYVWAAAGPSSYDCSGLVMRAWAAAGVLLPHNAAMQSTYGTRVPLSDLQPGDLLFFFSPISHVGIYLGNGLMLHAPHTGDVVRIASVFQTPAAAVRL